MNIYMPCTPRNFGAIARGLAVWRLMVWDGRS